MTNEQLTEIRKRAEAATAGPWGYAERDNVVFTKDADYKYAVEIAEEVGHKFDGEFIAHARQDVPKLLAEIERLRGVLIQCRCEECGDELGEKWKAKSYGIFCEYCADGDIDD